jgi:cell division protein FtsB
MRRSHDRAGTRRFWIKRVVLVLLVVLVFFLGVSVWGVYEKYKESKERKEELAHTLLELEKREIDLRQKVEALETERGVESEIRSKYQVAKEGEGVIYLVENQNNDMEVAPPKRSVWEWLLSWFGF